MYDDLCKLSLIRHRAAVAQLGWFQGFMQEAVDTWGVELFGHVVQ
jgi:hypothetical protein